MVSSIEFFMYRISDVLLLPVLLAIMFVFFYGFYSLGGVAVQAWQRKRSKQYLNSPSQGEITPGYELRNHQVNNPELDFAALEVFAFKRLEFLKLVTKVAPMLGLIATMIPMGPALKSLADGNMQGISESLSIAFSGVIFALVAASLTYVCLSVKKRWLAQELLQVREVLEEFQTDSTSAQLHAVKEA